MKIYLVFLLCFILASCSTTPAWVAKVPAPSAERVFYLGKASLEGHTTEEAREKAYQDGIKQISREMGSYLRSKFLSGVRSRENQTDVKRQKEILSFTLIESQNMVEGARMEKQHQGSDGYYVLVSIPRSEIQVDLASILKRFQKRAEHYYEKAQLSQALRCLEAAGGDGRRKPGSMCIPSEPAPSLLRKGQPVELGNSGYRAIFKPLPPSSKKTIL